MEILQVCESCWSGRFHSLVKFIEFTIFFSDWISEILVSWEIIISSILDSSLKIYIFLSNLFLLGSLLFDEGLHLFHFLLKFVNILIILNFLVFHFFLGLSSDLICFIKRFLGHLVIFLNILIHVFQLIQVSELFLFIIDDVLLLSIDRFDNLISLGVDISIHVLDIVSFGF